MGLAFSTSLLQALERLRYVEPVLELQLWHIMCCNQSQALSKLFAFESCTFFAPWASLITRTVHLTRTPNATTT